MSLCRKLSSRRLRPSSRDGCDGRIAGDGRATCSCSPARASRSIRAFEPIAGLEACVRLTQPQLSFAVIHDPQDIPPDLLRRVHCIRDGQKALLGAQLSRYARRSSGHADRSGYPPVQHAEPNRSHFALAALQETGWTHSLITQSPSHFSSRSDRPDVDRLHHKASPDFARAEREILELHGSLKQIVCFSCQAAFPRDPFQVHLSELNPGWAEYADHIARKALDPKLNPDGDVDLEGKSYDDFKVPRCYECGEDSIRPNVVRRAFAGLANEQVMFGQNLSAEDKQRSLEMVDQASAMLVVGSSLATYSAFRLLKGAAEAGQSLCLLSVGDSRGEEIVPRGAGSSEDDPRILRLDIPSTEVLTRAAAECASAIQASLTVQAGAIAAQGRRFGARRTPAGLRRHEGGR